MIEELLLIVHSIDVGSGADDCPDNGCVILPASYEILILSM